MSSASLLRVSDFCRIVPKVPNNTEERRLKVRLVIVHTSSSRHVVGQAVAGEPNSALVSDRFLRRASIIAGQVVWIIVRNDSSNRRVAVRTILKEKSSAIDDSDSDDIDIVEITPVVATNLGLLFELANDSFFLNDTTTTTTTEQRHQQHEEARVEIITDDLLVAKMVTVRYWGRPAKIVGSISDNHNDDGLPIWPRAGVLLQPFALTATHSRSGSIFFLEIVEVSAGDDSPSRLTGGEEGVVVYKSSSNTAFRLETLPASSVCPLLPWRTLTRQLFEPPEREESSSYQRSKNSLIPHADVPKLLQTLHNPVSDECIFHVIGTEEEHHLVRAIETVADLLGRRAITVCGLAAYAYQSGCSVTSGSLNDKLTGLHAALEQAQYAAPALLLITDLDQEMSQPDERLRRDEESRIWSLLTEGLSSKPSESRRPLVTALPTTPSVLVVLSSRRALRPGPILQHLSLGSIPLSVPDQSYAKHLWTENFHAPLADGFSLLVKGRTAGEIVAVIQDYADFHCANDHNNDNPKAILEQLCAQQDKNRRKQSGVAKIPSVQWQDVGGLEHVRREIMEAIEYPLHYPHLFAKNGSAGRGVLLYGPPGTGKTLVAKAVATECGVPFLSVKGPELLGSYVGESEAQVRGVFEQARQSAAKNQPPASILFFDELDSLAPRRGDHASGGNVMDRVVATLFAELDKHPKDGCTVFCIGATNRPDLLDPALFRPGRLDRLVYLGVGTQSDQGKILAAQVQRLRLDGDADANDMADAVVAHLPPNLTGADISTICTGGLLRATQRLCQEADEELLQCMQNNAREGQSRPTLEMVLSSWTEERLEPVVTLDDLLEAAKEVVPSVSQAEMDKYERLRDQFKSSS